MLDLPKGIIRLIEGGYIITGTIVTYIEDKDLLKVTDGNVWKGPAAIPTRPDKRYVCQTDCIIIHIGYGEESQDKMQILEGFSNKKDRDREQQYQDYVDKYIKQNNN